MAEKKKPVSEWLPQVVAWVRSLITQSDHAQNNSAAPDYIKNRTHYVEISTSSVWNQTGCNVGSGTTSPGGYPATFSITIGDKYNVTISQSGTSKTYEGLTAEYDSVFNGVALRKNWSNSMGMSDTSTDALLLVVQPSNVVLRSADIYGENCTVQVSEVTETIHKLDPKYLPDNVNQLDSITTSKSGKVTTVTFEQTNGTETQFQVTDGSDGKSAYQVAVDNGYSGTEAQWLASLKGADGVSLGEVELVQQLSQDDDKVPSAKAVQDGIEVWRDNISYLYSANDLNFDGTNYVNTEWNPYSTDSDFEIRMQISDLLLGSMSNSDTIISCIKQVSPYPGFSIRRNSSTKLEVYINGGARMATVANKDVGSVNTIIFKRVGNVYTFTLNETSTSYTYPSNGVDNSGANTLHIGASLDANDAPFRYGKFKLDYIRVATNTSGFEQEVQLYADYQKRDKIYPKTSIPAVEGLLSTLNNVKIGAGWSTTANAKWLRLNPTQVTKLNEQDGMTLFISAKTDASYNYRYCKFFNAKKKASGNYDTDDTDGLRITSNSSQKLIVNGVTFSKDLYFMNIAIEVNKRLGRVRIWNDGYMVEEKINDAFKTAYFIDNDGVFSFDRGDYAQIWYNYQLYSGEIITDWKSTQLDRVIGSASPSVSYVSGFDKVAYTESKVCSSYNNISTAYYRQLAGSTKTYGTDGAYVDFVNSGAATNALGGSNKAFGCCWTCVVPFDVNSGTFKADRNKPCGDGATDGSVYVYYRNQDGTQGTEIEDYTSIGQGQYLFVGNGVKGYVSPYLEQVTYPSSIRVYPKTFLFAGCILNVRMDALYGDRFKDYITWDDFIMYSDNILATEIMPYITTEKADSLIDTNSTKSQFPSRLSMHDDKIYMLMHNPTTGVYTWKQINNS